MSASVRFIPGLSDRVTSTAKEAQHLIKATSGTLVGLLVTNFSGSDVYVQLHDKATAVTAGNVPIFMVKLPAGKSLGIDTPVRFTAGLQVAISSTDVTFTSAGAYGWFLAQVL